MIHVSRTYILAGVFMLSMVASAMASDPRYSGAAPGALVIAKTRLAAGDAPLKPALDHLVSEADRALTFAPVSVTQKTKLAPSGDRHDYMSTGPYWWPDPSTPDGLPYIRRDGVVNPESRTDGSDQQRLEALGNNVTTLALAYYFTGQEMYAAHAARLLRVWFLDADTKMNPHFNYSQGVPGSSEGRPAGMIEAGGVVDAADASGLLAGSNAWSDTDEAALQAWCGSFLDWMRTSRLGKAVSSGNNNQATMADVRALRLALKVERDDLARQIVEEAGPRRIAVQIAPDGSQPHELTRTKSFNYHRLNLNGLTQLAELGAPMGVDLWRYQTPDGRSLRGAVDYLYPYAADPGKKWPHEQIADVNPGSLALILRRAGNALGDVRYEAVIAKLNQVARLRMQLTHPAVAASHHSGASGVSDSGFTPLFNGKDLEGWNVKIRNVDEEMARSIFTVKDGVIHVFARLPDRYELDTGKNSTHGMIYTKKAYRNYIFRFEYKWGSKIANNFADFQYDAGCYYHVVNDKIWPIGFEYQIRYNHLTNQNHTGDFWSPPTTRLQWYSADGITSALPKAGGQPQPYKRGEHRASTDAPYHALDGQWNRCEVIVMGDRFALHKLNGVIVNYATDLNLAEGIIGLQSETAEIFYRNIEIKEFDKPQPLSAFLPLATGL